MRFGLRVAIRVGSHVWLTLILRPFRSFGCPPPYMRRTLPLLGVMHAVLCPKRTLKSDPQGLLQSLSIHS